MANRSAIVDLLECCLLLFLAGLDTVTNELSMAMHHLATSPEETELHWPPIPPRYLRRSRNFSVCSQFLSWHGRSGATSHSGGQDLKAGDMVMFSLAAADHQILLPMAVPGM